MMLVDSRTTSAWVAFWNVTVHPMLPRRAAERGPHIQFNTFAVEWWLWNKPKCIPNSRIPLAIRCWHFVVKCQAPLDTSEQGLLPEVFYMLIFLQFASHIRTIKFIPVTTQYSKTSLWAMTTLLSGTGPQKENACCWVWGHVFFSLLGPRKQIPYRWETSLLEDAL